MSCNYGLEGATSEWEGVPLLPRSQGDGYSTDVLAAHWQDLKSRVGDLPTALVFLFDAWVYKDKRAMFEVVDAIGAWAPVDHLTTPPDVFSVVSRPNVVPLAMSPHADRVWRLAGLDPVYVPHAIDTDVFKPTPATVTFDARDLMGVPSDAFVVTVNAANKGTVPARKAWAENLYATARFMDRHPDAWLYLHTNPQPGGGVGLDIKRLCQAVGIDQDRVSYVDTYRYLQHGITPEGLATIYTTSDVLLATSMGEGFGIPTIEAQACGTRVIVTDFAASADLVGDGYKVDWQPWWDEPQRNWFAIPLIPDIERALERSYEDREQHGSHSQDAVEFARQFDADRVFRDHWSTALDRLADLATERSKAAA